MKKLKRTLFLSTLWLSHAACGAVETLDPGKFLRERGWDRSPMVPTAVSPSPDIAPLQYYQKGRSVPSCGLIMASPNSKEPNFVELVGSDTTDDWPQCMDIVSMVSFKLQDRDYIAVEFVQRDTREDFYRHYIYVYRDPVRGYVTDEDLTEVVPGGSTASKTMDGVKFARAAYLARAFPQWRFLDRDFMSDKSSSFAILEDKKAQQCRFVAESGAAPVTLNHEQFAPGTKCVSVLASSRFEKAGTVYYLAMFRSEKGKQVVAVTSVSSDGKVTAEKALSDVVNRSGATKDMKTAKGSLSGMLR